MFTWICPQCGREVPPAYNECPDCTGKQPGQAAPPQPPPQVAAPQQVQPQQYTRASVISAPPPPAQPMQQASPAAWMPAQQQPAQGITLPPWLLSIVFAILFLAVGAGAYFGIRYFSGSSQASSTAPAGTESAPAAAAAKGKANTLQKYVEVVGMRLLEDPKQKPQVRFVVVNHSGAEIADLAANVNLWARTAKSDEEAVGTFSFKLPSLGAYETKEMSGPLNTKLRVYELPDWQNLVAEVQITSPE
ncbi:MAG TPA: zinc ribbon domain-containing protein [Bryobacteraceae bacterium]|nr:zinc ribbon domain-containing protein [Bryobacteraceae bacterium]